MSETFSVPARVNAPSRANWSWPVPGPELSRISISRVLDAPRGCRPLMVRIPGEIPGDITPELIKLL